MNEEVQIIYGNGKPTFGVLCCADYAALAGQENGPDHGLIPFAVGDFIRNPIRVLCVEADLRQEQLAERLGVSQGHVSRIEGRIFKQGDEYHARAR